MAAEVARARRHTERSSVRSGSVERCLTWWSRSSRRAFDEIRLHRLEIVHAVENMASCRVADKAGFALEGTLRSAMLHADGWHDMHLHAAIADG